MRYLLSAISCWLVLSLNAQDIYGCTSPFAPNYNPAATINDYTCDYDVQQLLADGYCIQELLDSDVFWNDFRGLEYGGGYIMHIDEEVGKALISSGSHLKSEDGEDLLFSWGCPQLIGTSLEPYSGEDNTLAIVSAGCTSVPNAAMAAYTFTQGGYTDWVLPSKGDRANWYSCEGCEYPSSWCTVSSSEYSSSEFWIMTTYDDGEYSAMFSSCTSSGTSWVYTTLSKNASRKVLPVRYADLDENCIGPASCLDWVQDGQDGPPLGVSCEYPLFNCESLEDSIWNEMASGVYPSDTSFLELGIESQLSLLVHVSGQLFIDEVAQNLVSLQVNSITGLPAGLYCDQSTLPQTLSAQETDQSTECFNLIGIPEESGIYLLTMNCTAIIDVLGYEIQIDGVELSHSIVIEETSSEILGCTYSDANNYNQFANSDDGSCVFALTGDDCDGQVFCGEGTTWNEALGICIGTSCPEDVNSDGIVGTEDLLQLLSGYGEFCSD